MIDKDQFEYDFDDDLGKLHEKFESQAEAIYKKFTGKDKTPISHMDICQYLRVINYNFVALSTLFRVIFNKQDQIEASLIELHNKVDSFVDANSTIEGSLNASKSDDVEKQ